MEGDKERQKETFLWEWISVTDIAEVLTVPGYFGQSITRLCFKALETTSPRSFVERVSLHVDTVTASDDGVGLLRLFVLWVWPLRIQYLSRNVPSQSSGELPSQAGICTLDEMS